jgi:hypothetical protein
MHFLIQLGLVAIGVYVLLVVAPIVFAVIAWIVALPFRAYGAFWDKVNQMGRDREWNAALAKLDANDNEKFIAAMRSGNVVEVRIG